MNRCNVCGAQEGVDTVEVFGKIAFVEHGCSACVGIVHFPNYDLTDRILQIKQAARYCLLTLFVICSARL